MVQPSGVILSILSASLYTGGLRWADQTPPTSPDPLVPGTDRSSLGEAGGGGGGCWEGVWAPAGVLCHRHPERCLRSFPWRHPTCFFLSAYLAAMLSVYMGLDGRSPPGQLALSLRLLRRAGAPVVSTQDLTD